MWWLRHVLRMENFRLPRKFLLSKPEIGWKRSRGGQVMTWHREMKEATRKLAAVGQCRLPGWGPRVSAHKWLSTLEDMARDRCQWRSCCNFLIDLHDSLTVFDPVTFFNLFSSTVKWSPFFFNLFFFSFFTSDSQQRKKTNKNKLTKL